MKFRKKQIAILVLFVLALTLAMPVPAQAASKPKLNKTKITVNVYGKKTYQLKVKGTSKKVTWKSSNKKVATVSKNGKVTGKKKGTAVITAKVSGKSYKCKVTVKDTHKHVWKNHYKTVPKQTWHGKRFWSYTAACSCGLEFPTTGKYRETWEDHTMEMVFAQELGEYLNITTGYWKRTPKQFDTFLKLCKKQGEIHSCSYGYAYVGEYYTIDGYKKYSDGKYCKLCGYFTGEWWKWN